MTKSAVNCLTAELTATHGEILKGETLRRTLGYQSKRSFYRAIAADEVPVSVFKIHGQMVWSARTRDVATWLTSLGGDAEKDIVT